MDYKKLIRDLYDMLDGIDFGTCRDYSLRCVDTCESKKDCIISKAAQAIKELQARAETAEAILDKYQTEIVPRLREMAERAERENKGLQALTRLIMGKEEINFCGYPIGKLQEFLEANPESKTIVFVSERTEE